MRDRNYERYAKALDACSALARRELEAFVGRLDTSRKKDCRDALLAFVPALVERYGTIAATASAEYYEQVRSGQIGGTYRARLADGEPIEKIESTVRYACGHLFVKEQEDGR